MLIAVQLALALCLRVPLRSRLVAIGRAIKMYGRAQNNRGMFGNYGDLLSSAMLMFPRLT